MKLFKAPPESAPHALRAMAMIARAARNGLGPPQRAMLNAVQQIVFQTELDIESLPSIEADELARHLDDPAQARQLVRLMVATGLAGA